MVKEITFDKFIRWAGVTLIVLAVLYMTNYLSSVLLPFFIAWFFAYLLYPVVKFIENKLMSRYVPFPSYWRWERPSQWWAVLSGSSSRR